MKSKVLMGRLISHKKYFVTLSGHFCKTTRQCLTTRLLVHIVYIHKLYTYSLCVVVEQTDA